ncbi:unnamed protein product, partial [Closterium sp. NIES-53]
RRIGMVMDVARTSMIHAAAPHFLWPFAVEYAAHHLNLQPRVSVPKTSPTLRWTGKVGDASVFRVWGSRAFVRDLSADKLSPRAVPCDVTFDESVPYYRLFPYRTAPLPPSPLFLVRGPPPVDPLPPKGPAPSGVSQVDAVEPVEVAVDSGAGSGGAEPGNAGSGGAAPGDAESGGAEPGGAESGSAEPGSAEPGGEEPGGAGSACVASRSASSRRELLSPQELREWFARRWSRAPGAGGTPGAAGTGGAAAAAGVGPVGASRAAGAGVGPAGGTAGAAGGTGAVGPAGLGAAGASGAPGAGAAGGVSIGGSPDAGPSAGAGVGAVGAGGAAGAGAAAGGTGAVPADSGDPARPRPYFVPLLEQVLGLPPSSGPAPSLECPQPVQSQSLLQPVSPLPAPSLYTGPTGGLTERGEPASRPALPVRAARTSGRAPRQRPPAVPRTHQMALRPTTASQRVPLPSPPASSLPVLADPESDSLRAASPTVARLLSTAVTDPSFESAAALALVAELVDFAACCRLDYATRLVAESASVCPPSVGGECALSTDVLEVLQEVLLSIVSLRLVLQSSLPLLADPASDTLRAASPTVARLLSTVVTDPSFESTAASALVAELVDFAARCRLDYAAGLVAESASVCPPSVGGECALSTDVLEVLQEVLLSIVSLRLVLLVVDIVDFDAILAAMYAVTISEESDCYRCFPPDPGIGTAALGAVEAAATGAGEAVALGASQSESSGAGESALSGTVSISPSLTFTLDSGASRSFFRDRTTLTPLSRPVAVSLADPSGGPVLSRYSTVLPCPAVPSGALSGLYLPSFSTNLVAGADLQDAGVDQFTPARRRVTHCTDADTAASGQVLAAASRSGPESAPCSCRLLSHETLLWHHRMGHPSLPRLRGMASRLLVSGLPRSLPPLPQGPGPPCVPCVEGRLRATPHSSPFPPTEAPMQTLHMDVWGPARVRGQGHERYFLLVVDDYSRYTTVFPLRSKGEVTEVLIDWIRAARLQLRRSFGSDFPVLRLHSDRGGEFSSGLLRAYCRARGIRQTFALPDSPQQNGIAERRIGIVMDVARTSMVHAAAPHFLWPFAVRYAAHQINLQPRVSRPETSPALLWTGKVGDASAFRVWGSWAFVRDLSADKLSPRAAPCVFLGFPPDAPGWQFYHPTSRRVLSSQDVTFDESVPFYRLFPYRTPSLPPPPDFLVPVPPR